MIKNECKKVDKGLVFIVEGNAERQFYEKLIEHICYKNNIDYQKKDWNHNAKVTDNLIITSYNNSKSAFYIKDSTSGSQLPLQKDNIVNIVKEYFSSPSNFGLVFICYDDETVKTRPYDELDIDAMILDLEKENISCKKIKANNTIENMMFHSIEEILKYLALPLDTDLNKIAGRSGKSKMERLFSLANKSYKTAGVVSGLINVLEMDKIIDKQIELKEIENIIKQNKCI
ncbi:MAG: hypothetical protein PHE29_10945 [Tissierellia bacterium]|nr:hypothetical protein [Tissierellia bacterium]